MVDKNKSGFALLVSLIVVGAVLSVGLVILDLTIKQVRLAATTKDSEIAFHAANAGMECARYWRRTLSSEIVSGNTMVDVACFGGSTISVSSPDLDETVLLDSGGGDVHQYEYEFSWGPADARRCTRVNQVVIFTPIGTADSVMLASNMNDLVPGYTDGNINAVSITCPAGSQCTTLAVRGYNQNCPAGSDQFGYGVVERKVLLEF